MIWPQCHAAKIAYTADIQELSLELGSDAVIW